MKSLALIVALLGLSAASAVGLNLPGDKLIVSADPEFPPFAWYDGQKLRGASLDIVLAALRDLKVPYEVRYVGPFSRLLVAAQQGDVDIITELKDTPERRDFLVYPPTPLFRNPTSVFVKAGAAFAFRSWDDLKPKRGGVTLGTRFGGGFDEFLTAQLKTAPGIKENFAKLGLGRVDYFVSPYYPAQSYLVAAHQEVLFTALSPPVIAVDNFVGWSKRSKYLPRLKDFDAALSRLVASGEVQRLIDEATKAWRANPTMVR